MYFFFFIINFFFLFALDETNACQQCFSVAFYISNKRTGRPTDESTTDLLSFVLFGAKQTMLLRAAARRIRHISTSLLRPSAASAFEHTQGEGGHSGRSRRNRAHRIILVRHGQSEGNVDESAYVNTADWQIPLTELGREQARGAGRELGELLGDESVFFYVSPYKRTLQTLEEIKKGLNQDNIWGSRQEPRIAEQQFGNFQDVEAVQAAKKEYVLHPCFRRRLHSIAPLTNTIGFPPPSTPTGETNLAGFSTDSQT
jgi:hypothetical protein